MFYTVEDSVFARVILPTKTQLQTLTTEEVVVVEERERISLPLTTTTEVRRTSLARGLEGEGVPM